MPGRLVLPRPRSGGPFLVTAHRGNRIHCPENSLAGFRRAIDDGADLLEADLRPTADGRFVCFHDATLGRTSDGRGAVEQQSLAELAAVRLRMGQRVWPSEHIPTLEEVAVLCPDDVYLALELKSHQFRKEAMCAALLSVIEQTGMRRRVILLSFHARHLNTMASVAPDIPSGIVSFRPWPHGQFDLLGPVMIALRLNPGLVRSAHRRGQVVCPLDATPDSRLRLYRRLGVDAVLSDDPGRTISAALQLR
jgi:glycerophosphoryl diester phosphodiesterase